MHAWAQEHELLSSPKHWERLSSFGLGPDYRSQLDRLAKARNGVDLSFLVNEGVAQMAVQLLPYFQHIVVKCGDRGMFLLSGIPVRYGNLDLSS